MSTGHDKASDRDISIKQFAFIESCILLKLLTDTSCVTQSASVRKIHSMNNQRGEEFKKLGKFFENFEKEKVQKNPPS